MDNRIESFFSQAARHAAELLQQTNTCGAPRTEASAADSVEHGATDDGARALTCQASPGGTGDTLLDDQLVRARTGGPAAASSSKPRAATMTATGQYHSGDHASYVLKFDRPVSRAEVERTMFKDGHLPAPELPPYEDANRPHDHHVELGAVNKGQDGRSDEWILAMPLKPVSGYRSLQPGLDDKLLAAPGGAIAPWVPTATREILASKQVPLPGDPRFAQVENGYPPPHEKVTVWRDGQSTFRFDGETGRLEGFRDAEGAEMIGFNKAMQSHVIGQGVSIDEATARTQQEFHAYFADAILSFVVDG